MNSLSSRFLVLALAAILASCHLVDRRDFNPNSGKPPAAPPPPPAPPGPAPLLRISYAVPDPNYGPALAEAVHRALAVKPNVLFSVVAVVPLAHTPEAQVTALEQESATAREIAEAIVTDGADPGQIELAVRAEPGLKVPEVRIFVH